MSAVLLSLPTAALRERYGPRKYDHSPCAGLAAGDVCPAVLLPCALPNRAWNPADLGADGCRIDRLGPGFGFNPSIVRAPPEPLAELPPHLRNASYVAVDRFEANSNFRCPAGASVLNENVPSRSRGAFTQARLHLLDAELRVLASAPVEGGRCVSGIFRVGDSRLHVIGSSLWATYVSMFSGCESPRMWLVRVALAFGVSDEPAAVRMNSFGVRRGVARLRAHFEATNVTGGFGLHGVTHDGTPRQAGEHRWSGNLTGPRNAGVLVGRSGAPKYELTDISPKLVIKDGRGGVFSDALAPRSFRGGGDHDPRAMHNSISPLWVEELGLYVGVAHRHYQAGSGSRTAQDPFRYGFSYRHVFFTMRERPNGIVSHSRELCFPTLDGDGEAACDGVQFVMGAFRPTAEIGAPIAFTYGVMDCESAVLTLSLDRLRALLEFTPHGNRSHHSL